VPQQRGKSQVPRETWQQSPQGGLIPRRRSQAGRGPKGSASEAGASVGPREIASTLHDLCGHNLSRAGTRQMGKAAEGWDLWEYRNEFPNMGEFTTIVGFMAGFVTTAANLPQVWKTYRSKSGEGLSFRMLLALAIGLGLWIVYGTMSKLPPLIVTNAVALLLILSLLGMKLKYDRAPTKD
jgi:MtN3 and saliva related transmembrane protein